MTGGRITSGEGGPEVHRFSLEALTRALEAHVLPREADAVARTREFWDIELEGSAPRTRADVDAFVDALVDVFGDLNRSADGGPDLAPIRRVLGELLSDGDADAAVDRHARPSPPPPRRRSRERPAAARRSPSIGWRIYWALAVLGIAAAIVAAVMSGTEENIVVASILSPGIVLIVAGIASAVGRRR